MKISSLEVKFAILMSAVTTFFVTIVLTAVHVGFNSHFFINWLSSWVIAFSMVACSILFVAPKIRAFLSK